MENNVPATVIDLVERFKIHHEAYHSGHYNETQVRREFIDPLFEALGWDVNNRQGTAEPYKDVIHEDSIAVDGGVKAPDYAFRTGGARRFFVEAKKPSVNIFEGIPAAYQLRRYAWSANLPLSILTDFEELAVYDCRGKPDRTDKPATGRILYLGYREYPARWQEIAGTFSREAVLKGAFDQYAETTRAKHGTAAVDDAFLAEISRWRELLAGNIALRNPGLNQRELNYAVQMTIDRVIFLRICEDRGIEFYGQLMALLNGGDVYARMGQLFRKADERYDSGLFHFHDEKGQNEEPDRLTPGLAIDDAPLKDLLRNVYYPDSPYAFQVLPADILGQVYEQFLGKVIRLDEGHRAVVEDKPEVKKAGGVFYTPTYIVEYIVRNTLGKLLEGKTPGEKGVGKGTPLRVLDPACGSGSFLLGAYQYLLDWYRDGYVAAGPEKATRGKTPALFQAQNGEWRLTTAERKRILLDHVYGVDIDAQAVEVTKLSLLLKVLEGESEETLGSQLRLFQERALPNLGRNIQCGNSLIGPDFYDGAQMDLLNSEEQYRVNAFDWRKCFAEVFQTSGGFDAVIGNPPYIRIQTMKEWAPVEVEFYKKAYQSASKGNYDIYVVFVEKGLSLLNDKGRLAFILPHKFFNAQYGEPLRGLIARGKHLAGVVHFGDNQVFENATTYTCLLFLAKSGVTDFLFEKVGNIQLWLTKNESNVGRITSEKVSSPEWNFTVAKDSGLFEKLSSMPVKLGNISSMFVGLQTSADTVFLFKDFKISNDQLLEVYSKELHDWLPIERDILKEVVRSGDIDRYHAKTAAYILFPYDVKECEAKLFSPLDMQKRFPLAWKYLNRNKKLLEGREKGKFTDKQWYRFGRNQNLGLWERHKLMVPYMVTRLASYIDQGENLYFINVTTGGYGIVLQPKYTFHYICGLLNSKLLDFYLKNVTTPFHGGYYAANKQFIEQLPIWDIDFSKQEDIVRHDRMVSLVERMLALHKQLAAARTPSERVVLERQVEATDGQIDRLVYELYGLSEEEIKIVEGR